MKYVLILKREVQTGNQFAYAHWRNRMRDKQAWQYLVNQVVMLARFPAATQRRHVTVIAYRRRRIDDDNLIAGFKHGRDALVQAKMLLDDNAKWSEWTYRQELIRHEDNPTPGIPCTVVEITDA